MRVVYGAKNFQSGLNITFHVFDINETNYGDYIATEVGVLGVYQCEIPLPDRKEYVIGITEPDSVVWKDFKFISTYRNAG